MCGIIGIIANKPVATELYDGLIHLQHRGQDAAGMVTFNGHFHTKKGAGLVRDVFDEGSMQDLVGNWGLAHTRYSTVGSARNLENAQPFTSRWPYGMAFTHNGNLTNYYKLKKELADKNHYHCNSESDIEAIMGVFALTLQERSQTEDIFESICAAVESVYKRCHGGYSVICMIAGIGMIAFRDPHGIRPLAYGTRTHDGKTDYIFSSENTPYYALGFKLAGNVGNGEVFFVNTKGELQKRTLRNEQFTPCIFEYVYLARPDSVMNDISIYRARLRMGENLGKKWQKEHPDIVPDVVIPIPFSSNTAALSMAHQLGVRYSEGLYKNAFIGRTFIMPGQEKRRKSVLQKLSPQEFEIRGKNVMLLDDSIVRGTTSKEMVNLVRETGAKSVYFVSACPPVKYPDFYGIDIPTRAELIAANKTEEEIREYIGADILLYQDIDGLVEAVTRKGEHHIDRPSMPYLDGWYVTGDVDEAKIKEMEDERNKERG